ncbi:unnamed protein product [Toxocara canis]|uniref:Ovule protein n=1 Tax=Toxocara canis TaxID=6265 RepID=A0A183UIS7_TOXCA|nr:unnamed protein product [Toxocara canis]
MEAQAVQHGTKKTNLRVWTVLCAQHLHTLHMSSPSRTLWVMSAEDLTTTVHQLNSNHSSTTATLPQYSVPAPQVAGASKYSQLLSVCFLFFLQPTSKCIYFRLHSWWHI